MLCTTKSIFFDVCESTIITPIFNVNGDDPEAVVFVTRLALAYRQKITKDVVIDLV